MYTRIPNIIVKLDPRAVTVVPSSPFWKVSIERMETRNASAYQKEMENGEQHVKITGSTTFED